MATSVAVPPSAPSAIASRIGAIGVESNLDDDYAVGDRLIVRLTEVKENGDVAFDDVAPDDYRTEAYVILLGSNPPGVLITQTHRSADQYSFSVTRSLFACLSRIQRLLP